MKKWLVGLLAAGLCAASAWATNYTLVTSMEEFGAGNYVITGEKKDGGEHAMQNVVASGNFIQTADVAVADGVISDPDASIVWAVEETEGGWTIFNEDAGGYVNYPGGKNNAATQTNVTDASTWTISFADGVSTVDNVGTSGRKLQYNKSSPRFACYTSAQTPLKFYKEGDGTFSVEVEPSVDFRKEAEEWVLTEGNQGAYLTAVPKNGVGDVSYEWLGSFEGTDEILRIPDGLVAGTDGPTSYSVTVTATDSSDPDSRRAMAEFSFTLARAPGLYTVAVADGIENGTVEIWQDDTQLESPAEVYEGTAVKVVATPADRSFKVESVGVAATDDPSLTVSLEDGEFTMPGFGVTVTATFVERTSTAYAIVESMDDFEAGADYLVVAFSEGKFTSAMKNEYVSGYDGRIAVDETVAIVEKAIETEDDSLVWRIAAGTGEATYTLYNAAAGKYVAAPSVESVNEALLVDDGRDAAAQWTIAIDTNSLATIGSFQEGKSLQRNNNANNKFFANYKGGAKPFLFKKVGPGVFSISLEPSGDAVTFPEGEGGTIRATPRNAQGEVTYAWSTADGAPGSAEGNVWTIPAETPAGGPWTVSCNANDGTSAAEEVSVTFSVVGEPEVYEVTVAEGIENGDVSVEPSSGIAGTTITVTATPDEGYRSDGIYVNGDPIDGTTFALPEGGATVSASFVVSSTKTATYTVESTSVVSVSGTVPPESEAVYASTYGTACQLVGGSRMTLTLKGYEGATITGLTLSMKSNARGGAGSLRAECGDAVIGAIEAAPFSDETWNGTYTQEYVDINVPVTATLVDGDVVITLAATANSLYCQSFTIEYEPGEPVFSVGFDKEDGFTVPLGETAIIRAIAQNGVGEVTYAWDSDTPELNGSGPELEIPGTLEPGGYSVKVTATDSSEEPRSVTADISFVVAAPPPNYTVSIAEGIENGTVSIRVGGEAVETPASLEEGTEVTVVAEPAGGFALEAIRVNGDALDGDTFTVAGDAEVSATFTELQDYATLPFLAENTPFTGPWQNPKADGVTVEGLGPDYDTAADGRGGRFDTSGDWLQVKFEGTPGTLSYALKGNGTTNTCVFKVQESATGAEEDWSTLATYPSEDTPLASAKTEFSNELKADSRFVRFLYETKVAGNVALYDVYISSGGFSVGVDKNGFKLEPGQGASVTAEAKNGVVPYDYQWSSETPELGGSGPVLEIPGTLEPGEYSVTVRATDSSDEPQSATADVTFTVLEPKPTFTVTVAGGIENGSVAIRVGGEAVETPAVLSEGTDVTVVATPFAGFKTAGITVNGTHLDGDTFTVTEDAEVSASFAERGDEFVKIAGLDELDEGEYVITGAGTDGEYAMLAELSEGNKTYVKRQEEAVEIENGDTISGPADSIVWTLGKVADGWTIHNAAIGFVGYVAGDNTAGAEEEASEKSTWTIGESSGGLFQLTNVGNTGRYLLYNSGSPRFACYTGASSSIKALAFYKKAGAAEFEVGVDKEDGFEVVVGRSDSITASAKNGAKPYAFAWTGDLEGDEATLEIPGTLETGAYTVTVTATDSSEPQQSATATVSFRVVDPLPVYTVTVAEGIENGEVTVDKTSAEAGETVTVTATPAENYKLVAILVNGGAIEGNTFEIAADSVVSAEFAPIVRYPVTIDEAIVHGTVEADKTEAEAGETVTLSATPDKGWKLEIFLLNGLPIEGNTFEMPEGEALVSATFVERVLVTYVPVEKAADFVAGEEYLIVAHKAEGFTSAMKNAANGDRIGLDEVEIAADGSITTDNADIVWQIKAGAGENQYVLFNGAGVYAAAKSDGNYAQILTDGEDELAQWTLDLSALPEVKISSVPYSSRWLQRNSTPNNKFFATYTGSQTTPLLFKKAGFSVGFDKEDGFTVEAGQEDAITAAAVRGTEPYRYVWTGDLEGEGETLAIPDTLETGVYSVTVTATDSSDEPRTATAGISFEVVAPTPKFTVSIADGIEGGTVAIQVDGAVVDAPATLPQGTEVKVVATPFDGFTLGTVTVTGATLGEDSTFVVEGDAVVSATFDEVVDYATLPFVDKETPYPGPWKNPEVPGLTNEGLDSDYGDGSAKFRTTGAWMQIKFRGTPGTLSFGIKGNSVNEDEVSTFVVQESADGENWTPVAVFTTDDNLTNSRRDVSYALSEDSRFVRFLYQEKAAGNVGIYDVYIGEAGEAQPAVTVTGETALRLGGTFALELGLENYSGGFAWAWAPATVGYVDAETATWWWQPTKTGETEVTFSAMNGDRTIASETVTLTVAGEPALVFGGDAEGTVGTAVNFTVEAVNVADPTVTFMGFLEVPEGSTLTAEDIVLAFPAVTFTPDVAGEYGLSFSAGTVGADYVEDARIVTVAAAPAEPAVTLLDGETTVALGSYFLLEFGLENYDGPFGWTVAEGDGAFVEGLYTWTPDEAGTFTIAVAAVDGETVIATSEPIVLTVTGETPPAEPPRITKIVEIDLEAGEVTLEFTGSGTAVWATDDLMGTWGPVDAVFDGDKVLVETDKHFLRVQ